MVDAFAARQTTAEIPEDRNPYVGPQPFRQGDPIYGREREIAALRHFLLAERIVLLYSPSGAGKSSLVQAGLIPALGSRFEIWGPTRVNQAPPPDSPAANRYVWSAIQGFEHSLAEDVKHGLADASRLRPPEELASASLNQYVETRLAGTGGKTPVLIFDQFEEVVRVDTIGVDAIGAFFDQLGEVLFNPRIWALFVLREDYLAPLDDYARQLPTHLQNRYRIDRLRTGPAMEAILKPTAETHRKYAPGVVEALVRNLAKVKVQQLGGGGFLEQDGTQVEPLQLQVVCYDLWERIRKRAGPREISAEDVGDLTNALSNYYARSVEAASGKNEKVERRIREWFRDHLITPDGVRNQVRQEGNRVGGLELAVVSSLVDIYYLVRMEPRANAFWYELSHDRLVNPVRNNNAEWFNRHLNKTQQRALQWDREKEPRGLLLVDADLIAAEQWAAEPDVEPNAIENRFLAACRLEQERVNANRDQAERDRRQVEKERANARRQRGFLMLTVVLLCVAGLALWYAVKSADVASKSEQKAVASKQDALEEAVEAKWHSWYATSERFFADQQKANAERQAQRADEQEKGAEHERLLATARELAATATRSLAEDPERGLILAIHSLAKASLPVALTALHAALLTPRRITLELGRYPMALALAGKQLAAFASDGTARVWDLETRQDFKLSFDAAPSVNFESVLYRSTSVLAAVSLDSAHAAATTKTGLLYLWESAGDWSRATRRIKQLALPPGDSVRTMALSPRGDLLAMGTQEGKMFVWRTPNFEPVPDANMAFRRNVDGNQYCSSVSFSPDGKTLLAVSAEGRVSRFDLEKRQRDDPAWSLPIYVERIAIFPRGGPDVPVFGSGWGTITAPVDDVKAHGGPMAGMALNRDGTRLVTASEDGNAILWDARKGTKLQILARHQGPLSALTFSGSRVAIGSAKGRITIIDLGYDRDFEVRSFRKVHDEVTAIAFGPDNETLASGGGDGTTKLWNLATGGNSAVIPPLRVNYNPRVTGLSFSARGERLATSSWNQYVRVLDVSKVRSLCREGQASGCLPDAQKFGPLATMGGVSFGPDGSLIALSADGAWLWRPRPGADGLLAPDPLHLLPGQEATAIFARDGSAFATAAFTRGRVELWALKETRSAAYGFVEKDAILLDVSRAGRRLAISAGPAVKVIDVIDVDLNSRTHREKIRLNDVSSYASFSPDGGVLAVSSSDQTVKLWNVDAGELLLTLAGHEREATRLAFSGDGKRLASGGRDGSVQVYALTISELLQIARNRIHRELTAEECEEYLHSRSCPANAEVIRGALSRGGGR